MRMLQQNWKVIKKVRVLKQLQKKTMKRQMCSKKEYPNARLNWICSIAFYHKITKIADLQPNFEHKMSAEQHRWPLSKSQFTSRSSSSSGILLFQQQVNDSHHLAGGSQQRRTAATAARHPWSSRGWPAVGGSWRRRTAATVARHLRSSHRWESRLGKIVEVVSRCLPRGFYLRVSFS